MRVPGACKNVIKPIKNENVARKRDPVFGQIGEKHKENEWFGLKKQKFGFGFILHRCPTTCFWQKSVFFSQITQTFRFGFILHRCPTTCFWQKMFFFCQKSKHIVLNSSCTGPQPHLFTSIYLYIYMLIYYKTEQ